jgi:hypothetical protein
MQKPANFSWLFSARTLQVSMVLLHFNFHIEMDEIMAALRSLNLNNLNS